MSTATHTLHNDLYINLTERACTDRDDPVWSFCNNEGGIYIGHVKQCISRLRDKQLRLNFSLCNNRNRNMVVQYRCMLNNFGFRNIAIQILLQHPLNHRRVSAVASKERCRFERSCTSPQRKAFCIDSNTSQQRCCFTHVERDTIMNVLKQLCHELTR